MFHGDPTTSTIIPSSPDLAKQLLLVQPFGHVQHLRGVFLRHDEFDQRVALQRQGAGDLGPREPGEAAKLKAWWLIPWQKRHIPDFDRTTSIEKT